jgi:hypothetical protein
MHLFQTCRELSFPYPSTSARGGIKTEIGCHTFRATGITAYLKNGGKLEIAQQWPSMNQRERQGFMTAGTICCINFLSPNI